MEKLTEFVRQLSVDVHGDLTSAAQVKATSLELARNCQETAHDVKSLGVILKVLNAEVQGNVQSQMPELNPF